MQPDRHSRDAAGFVDMLELSFKDLFDGLDTFDLRYRQTVAALSGQLVRLTGFLSPPHGPSSQWSLVTEPGACPDCSPLPAPVVALPDLKLRDSGDGSLPVSIEGRLSFGLCIKDGVASFLRIEEAQVRSLEARS